VLAAAAELAESCSVFEVVNVDVFAVYIPGALGGAAQAVGPTAEAPAGERTETAAGSEADSVHARV